MATEDQVQLFQALKAHKAELETQQSAASGLDQEVLDHRIEAARLLLEWLSPILATESSNSNAAVTSGLRTNELPR